MSTDGPATLFLGAEGVSEIEGEPWARAATEGRTS